MYWPSVDGSETASILTRSHERRFLLRHHLLPTAVVLVGIGGLVVVGALVFVLVFLIDDQAELRWGEAVTGIASLVGVILGATLAVTAVALVFDRVTLRAPLFVRILAPVVVPLAGAALVAAGIDFGFLVIELSVLLAGYWALFLAQGAVFRLLRLLRIRVTGTTGH